MNYNKLNIIGIVLSMASGLLIYYSIDNFSNDTFIFFAISAFICFSVGLFIFIKIYKFKNSTKDKKKTNIFFIFFITIFIFYILKHLFE